MQPVPHHTSPDQLLSPPALESNYELDAFYGQGKASTLWNDKEAWAIRERAEEDFYAELLRRHGASSVLDVSAASGFHVIPLARAGFRAAATDGFEGFVTEGRKNVEDAGLTIPFLNVLWRDLPSIVSSVGTFDAALCLGSSLHHTDLSGVAELFQNMHALLNPNGKFIVEQRNYERLFQERPEHLAHPCG